jgi:hypothetical protein
MTPQSSNHAGGDAPERLEAPDPAQQFGKAAADDAELADRLADATDDLDRAESEFDDARRGPVRTGTAQPDDQER